MKILVAAVFITALLLTLGVVVYAMTNQFQSHEEDDDA